MSRRVHWPDEPLTQICIYASVKPLRLIQLFSSAVATPVWGRVMGYIVIKWKVFLLPLKGHVCTMSTIVCYRRLINAQMSAENITCDKINMQSHIMLLDLVCLWGWGGGGLTMRFYMCEWFICVTVLSIANLFHASVLVREYSPKRGNEYFHSLHLIPLKKSLVH